MAKAMAKKRMIAGAKFWDLPLPFLLTLIFIMAAGLITLYSATGGRGPFHRQMIWNFGGLACMFAFSLLNLKRVERYCHFIYLGALILLAAVFVIGKVTMGAQRWIPLGPIRVQPSELAKLALVLALARVLVHQKGNFALKDLWKPAVLVMPAFVLTLLQPDLGTAMILLALSGTLVLVRGVGKRTLVTLLAFFFIVGVVGGPFVWSHLKGYQKRRILAFINPQAMAKDAGYHVLQSQTAIGSGRVWGKGFLRGSQGRLDFLPEEHTDFIFSVFAEERGFVGVVILLGLYFFLVFFALSVAVEARDAYSFYVAVGVATIYALHFVINVGMTMGLLPVVGVPLPLMSYGGSSLITTYLGAGLVMAVHRRRTG